MLIKTKIDYRTKRIEFVTLLDLSIYEVTLLNLYSYYLTLANKYYRTPITWDKKLASMYGAKFFADVESYGPYKLFSIGISFLDDKYFNDSNYTNETMAILAYNAAFNPLLGKNGLQKKLFARAKREYKDDLYIRNQDFDIVSDELAFESFFEGTKYSYNCVGNLKILDKITIEELNNFYKTKIVNFEYRCLANFETKILDLFDNKVKYFPFAFTRKLNTVNTKFINSRTSEMYYDFFIETSLNRNETDISKLMILEEIFFGNYGIFFKKLREEYGLCYTIEGIRIGTFGMLKGHLISHSRDISLIKKYIEEILTNKFTKEQFLLAKENIKNSICRSNDHLGHYFTMVYLRFMIRII